MPVLNKSYSVAFAGNTLTPLSLQSALEDLTRMGVPYDATLNLEVSGGDARETPIITMRATWREES